MEDIKEKTADEITLNDYLLTNLGLDGYYRIELKDNQTYKIYPRKEGRSTRDYIKKDGKWIRLSYEVQKVVMSCIREYERYGI